MRTEDLPLSGEPLRARLKQLGLTQADLADQLDIRPQAVSRWVAGLNYPAAKHIQQLVDILQLEVETRSDNERLDRLEQAVSRLADALVEQKEQLAQLIRQTEAAAIGSATPSEQGRRGSRR